MIKTPKKMQRRTSRAPFSPGQSACSDAEGKGGFGLLKGKKLASGDIAVGGGKKVHTLGENGENKKKEGGPLMKLGIPPVASSRGGDAQKREGKKREGETGTIFPRKREGASSGGKKNERLMLRGRK